jgi:hypothetical protein
MDEVASLVLKLINEEMTWNEAMQTYTEFIFTPKDKDKDKDKDKEDDK